MILGNVNNGNNYKLVREKKMGDGNVISQNQKLTLIKKDNVDGMLFLETNDDDKKIFWANKDEVEPI